jgi:hypothetical protein
MHYEVGEEGVDGVLRLAREAKKKAEMNRESVGERRSVEKRTSSFTEDIVGGVIALVSGRRNSVGCVDVKVDEKRGDDAVVLIEASIKRLQNLRSRDLVCCRAVDDLKAAVELLKGRVDEIDTQDFVKFTKLNNNERNK